MKTYFYKTLNGQGMVTAGGIKDVVAYLAMNVGLATVDQVSLREATMDEIVFLMNQGVPRPTVPAGTRNTLLNLLQAQEKSDNLTTEGETK